MSDEKVEKVEKKDNTPVESAEKPESPAGNESPEEKAEEKPDIKLSKFADIFVTESDTFDIAVKYYKKEDRLIVVAVDDEFDENVECTEFEVIFKYPDQGDTSKISSQVSRLGSNPEELDVREFMGLEFARILCLIRSWTIDSDMTNQSLMKLHPKIVKSLINQVRDKIGMDGII